MKRILLLLTALAIYQQWGQIERWFSPAPTFTEAEAGEIILYSTAWCGYCDKTREQLVSQGNIFQEYDIEQSEEGRRQFDALKGRGVPLVKAGNTLIHGYSASQIRALER
ncbi:MAG: glutaredoxin family protein [Pseudomonas sp.]